MMLIGALAMSAGFAILLYFMWRGLSSVVEDFGWRWAMTETIKVLGIVAALMAACFLIVYGFYAVMDWPMT